MLRLGQPPLQRPLPDFGNSKYTSVRSLAWSNFDRSATPAKLLAEKAFHIYGQSCDLLGFFHTIAQPWSLPFHSNVFAVVDIRLRIRQR